MTDSAPAIFVALEASGLGAAIRQSRWLYMVANIGHIVALTVFASAVAIIDVRLLGGFRATSAWFVIRDARQAALIGFAALVITGAGLFAAEASHVVLNRAFQIKAALVALGLANAAWVEVVLVPKLHDLPATSPLPSGARPAAVLSLAVWLGVAICGRAIAYF